MTFGITSISMDYDPRNELLRSKRSGEVVHLILRWRLMQLGRYSAEQCLRPANYSPASLQAQLKDMRDAPTEYHDGLTALGQAAGWLVVSSDVSSDNRE